MEKQKPRKRISDFRYYFFPLEKGRTAVFILLFAIEDGMELSLLDRIILSLLVFYFIFLYLFFFSFHYFLLNEKKDFCVD